MNRTVKIIKNTVYGDLNVAVELEEKDPQPLFGFQEITKTFVGRKKDSEKILKHFEKNRRVLIAGIGGIGKTSLSIYCCQTWIELKIFKYAVFVNMETEKSAKDCFCGLAEEMFREKSHNANTVKRVYERYNKDKTLFVFDNIEQNGVISKFMPPENLKNIYILGTSQCEEYQRIFEIYRLNALSKDASLFFVRETLTKENISISGEDQNKILELIDVLEYHPLALDQAISSIIDTVLYEQDISLLSSLEDYLKEFNLRLNDDFPEEYISYYKKPVYAALKINIDKVSKIEDCKKLLFCIAFLEPTYIDTSLFHRYNYFEGKRILTVLRFLKKFSLVAAYKENYHKYTVRIHRLTQLSCRILLRESENFGEKEIVEILLHIFFAEPFQSRHIDYFIKTITFSKEEFFDTYIKRFHKNEKIIEELTDKLQKIDCNLVDIKTWNIYQYFMYSGHFELFNHFFQQLSDEEQTTVLQESTWPLFFIQILKYSLLKENGSPMNFKDYLKNYDINSKGVRGLGLLHFAASFEVYYEHFIELIDSGCDINARDINEKTPLDFAIKNENYDLAYELIKRGANYEHLNAAILAAAAGGDEEFVFKLIDHGGANIKAEDEFGNTPLLLASKYGHCDLAMKLIEKGGKDMLTNGSYESPLMWAADNGLRELALALIEKGLDINVVDSYNNTPILLAAENGFGELAIDLVKKGANVNVSYNYGTTPLMLAARNGDMKLAMQLLLRGAEINASDDDGDTPLLYALRYGNCDLGLELVKRGANINVKHYLGGTPLLFVGRYGHMEFAIELMNTGADINEKCTAQETPFLYTCRHGQVKLALEMIKRGADINAANDEGETALIFAIDNGDCDLARELIQLGVKLNVETEDGDTPLLLAAKYGHSDLALDLISKGANTNVTNNDGETPLSWAFENHDFNLQMELKKYGATTSSTTKKRKAN